MNIFKKLFWKDPAINMQGSITTDKGNEIASNAYGEFEFYPSADTKDPFCNMRNDTPDIHIDNQWYAGTCTNHAITTAIEIALKKVIGFQIDLSNIYAYFWRSNNTVGSSPWEIADISCNKKGFLPYSECPTPQGATDETIAELQKNRELYSPKTVYEGYEVKYFAVDKSPSSIATILNQGDPVQISIYGTTSEWSRVIVDLINKVLAVIGASIRHSIVAIPYGGFTDEKGIKRITILDSAWFGGFKVRHLSEEFLSNRIYIQPIGFKAVRVATNTLKYPTYKFTSTMGAFQANQKADVIALQKVLVAEGLLSKDLVTGNYFNMTKKAVAKFQEMYKKEILIPLGLTKGTGIVGESTLKVLNKLCK